MKTMTTLAGLLLCAAALADNITQNHEAGAPYVDRGATALDSYDLDCTARIVATGIAGVTPNMLGTYTVIYNVTDLSGNAADPTVRTVIVKDTRPPVITLKGAAILTVPRGTPALSIPGIGATALDSFSGACTVTAVSVPALDTTKAGIYVITFAAKDSSGNPATPVTQTVKVMGKPVITINP